MGSIRRTLEHMDRRARLLDCTFTDCLKRFDDKHCPADRKLDLHLQTLCRLKSRGLPAILDDPCDAYWESLHSTLVSWYDPRPVLLREPETSRDSILEYRKGVPDLDGLRITCLAKGGKVELTIDPRRGEYEGMPERRAFRLKISVPAKPHHVEVNDVALAEAASSEGGLGWWYDLGESQVRLNVEEDPHRTVPVTVQIVY